jgi:hypothetical protein
MTAWIVLVVCVIGLPDRCKEVDGGVAESFVECLLHGEEVGAAWLDRHPGYGLTGVRCYVGEKPELGEDT